MILRSRLKQAPTDAFSLKASLFVLAGWTGLLVFSAAVNIQQSQDDALVHARLVADAYIDKDLSVRRWITEHGGVYVRPTDSTPPNPWLDVPNRDVVTTGGTALTLVNPAYATRKLMENFAAEHGIRGHLTALQLKNPDNAPDAWESAALKRLQAGEKEVFETVSQSGGETLRVMRPVYMEKGCLKCHADMNIPLGGLRGGISSAIPLQPFREDENATLRQILATHGTIWLVGLAGIGWTNRRNRDAFAERNRRLLIAQREDRRIAEVLSMSERLGNMSEREIIQQGLETAERLSGSKIAYFHFVNEDQNTLELVAWSRATLESYCQAAYDSHYPLEQAGVWADCARLHQPVVHNDYPNLAIKRGLPDGHAELTRLLSVPVIEGGKVRVITGVGNKESNYEEEDVRLVQLLANDIWKLVQRKRGDDELRASEQLLRTAQQVARMGSWTLNHASGEMNWSQEMFAIFGVDRSNFKPTRDSLINTLIHPDDRAAAANHFNQAIAEHREYNRAERICLPSGEIRWIRFQAATEYQSDGTPVVSTGTAQDVTEQREVEKIRQGQADLNALFEHTERFIWSIDAQCRLIVGNTLFQASIRRQIGRNPTPGEQLPVAGLPGDLATLWRGYYQRALAGEKFSVDLEIPLPDEGKRWMEYSFFPICDGESGEITGATVFGRDFTDQREMEETRKRTLARMAHMVRELESHQQQSLAIKRLNDLLQSCRDEDEAYGVIALLLGEIFAGHIGSLAVVTSHERELHRVCTWGQAPASTVDSFSRDDCWALRRGEVHELHRGGQLACRHFTATPANGYTCLPLMVRGNMLGLLTLEHPAESNDESLAELKSLMGTVGETIKLSISNLRLRVALEERATHDALTGLFNRRYLDETLPRELHRAQRNQSVLTVAMIDIDHFKRFNDEYGHEAGDLVLCQLGELLNRNLRRSDIGCRYGGEEMLLIMPDSGAADVAERLTGISEQIRQTRVRYRDDDLPTLTVSVGIASTDKHGFETRTLLRAADQALYAAKQAGRDRIRID
jgi:diguanylate cyclase (GGDEF)-like protein/PAS domain S-box-containing protein